MSRVSRSPKPRPLGQHTRQDVLIAKNRLHLLKVKSERDDWTVVLEAEELAAKEKIDE